MDVHIAFGAPQLILTFLLLMGWSIGISRYGQRKHDSYGAVDVFWGPLIVFSLLYWGGFYGS